MASSDENVHNVHNADVSSSPLEGETYLRRVPLDPEDPESRLVFVVPRDGNGRLVLPPNPRDRFALAVWSASEIFDGSIVRPRWAASPGEKRWAVAAFASDLRRAVNSLDWSFTLLDGTPREVSERERELLRDASLRLNLAGPDDPVGVAVTTAGPPGSIGSREHLLELLESSKGTTVAVTVKHEEERISLNVQARYLVDRPARMAKHTSNFLGLGFPKNWKRVRKWQDLVDEEKKRILEELGDAAFTKTAARGPLLKSSTTREGKELVELTGAARRSLEDREGTKGFRRTETDPDKIRREYLVRRSGSVLVGVSWYGSALPLVQDGPDIRREKIAAALEALETEKQENLFGETSEASRERLEGLLQNAAFNRYGLNVMEDLALAFGAEGRNPLRVPAWKLLKLLQLEADPNGLAKLNGTLRALQEIRFKVEAKKGASVERSFKSSGPFLSTVRYFGAGPGDHGDGDFELEITSDFLGVLEVFRSGEKRYDWTKKLSKEERAALGESGGFIPNFSTLAPYYDAAEGFTPSQKNLRRWIQQEQTLRRDSVRKERRGEKVKLSAPDAFEPRLYGTSLCPLIPRDRLFAGALGHFKKNPESGRTLGGKSSAATRSGGAHSEGLLEVMGYFLPPGLAFARRRELVQKALQDIRRVVEESLHGIAAGLTREGRWLSLDDAAALPEDSLTKEVRWFLFVTPDLGEHMGRRIEDHHEERRVRGETKLRVLVTRDQELAANSEAARRGERYGDTNEEDEAPKVGLAGLPLWIRLYAERGKRKLSQAEVGKLFGVSQPVLSNWEKDPTKKPNPKKNREAIPAEVVPLLVRWLDGGAPPTPEELAGLRSRRSGRTKSS